MSQVAYFIYADAVKQELLQKNEIGTNDQVDLKVQHDTTNSIINPQYVFRPSFIPSAYSFGICAGVKGIDFSVSHTIKLKFNTPDHKQIIELAGTMESNNQDTGLPPELKGIMLMFDLRNVPLETQGTYYSTFYIDDEELGTFPIDVWRKA